MLEGDQDPSSGFRAELVPSSRKINAERRAKLEAQVMNTNCLSELNPNQNSISFFKKRLNISYENVL